MSMGIPTEIPPEDKITLSPLDKYRIYGKFPFHMIIHIILLVFNTIQAMIILSEFTDYFRAQEKSFLNVLISEDSKENTGYSRKVYLYDIPSLRNHIISSIQKMLKANDTFLNTIIYVDENEEPIEIKDINMKIDYKINITELKKDWSRIPLFPEYNVTPNDIGPFNNIYTEDEIKEYLNIIKTMEMTYDFKIYLTKYYKEYKDCFHWKIRQIYDFTKNAHFEVRLFINNQQCRRRTSLHSLQAIIISHSWVHFIVIILASISILLCLKDFYEVIHLKKYRKIILKSQKSKVLKNPKFLKASETISKALNKWDIFIILSNLFQIIGSIVGIMTQKNMNGSMDTYVGFGVLLSYISLGKYLDYTPKYALFYRTFVNSMSDFIPSFIAIMPVFIAFTFLGLCLFWSSERFTGVSDIMKALFAIFLGDSIYDIMSDITERSNFFGQVYGYLYTVLFIIVVMNVFVAIIQEGFMKTKFESKSYWIYNSLQRNEESTNENLKNLPIIDEMSQSEIKEELENRIILMNKGLNKCINLIDEVEKNNIDEENKNTLRLILAKKIEDLDQKMEVIRVIWENK